MKLHHALYSLCCALVLFAIAAPINVQAQTQETTEVSFSSTEARWLKTKADELKTPVAIYEYLRNTVEYQPYWGSWSGSVNTFSALRGNDIDIASTLIAMLRSQGVPARYAVTSIRAPSTEIANWLHVGNQQVAVSYLKNAGTPDVLIHPTLPNTVVFEHVWVEALVPFDQYRGLALETNGVSCQVTPTKCQWVALDASFKQNRYLNKGVNPYSSVKWDSTDYTLYFNAIKNDDKDRRDKSVIHILEKDVLNWLSTYYTAEGKLTLDDLVDGGEIIPVLESLLPASLPYQLDNNNVRRYNTVAEHDTAEPSKPWTRKLKITVYPCHPNYYTGSPATSAYEISLADVATDRLVISNSTAANGSVDLNLNRGRGATTTKAKTWNFGSSVSCKNWQGNLGAATSFTTNSSFWIKLQTDKEPGFADESPASIHTATVGSRVLVAVGGETSNWGQVHRAAASLLEASRNYSIVYNASQALSGQTCTVATGSGCIPFVDSGPAGWDASDVKLVNNPSAVQDLQGGLLEVAAAQYFAETRDHYKRADGLLRMVTPLRRLVGLVKSEYDVQYLKDGTAFSIQPNGLVIDMSFAVAAPVDRDGIRLGADFDHTYFLNLLGSSLEHEVWQKLTGFDATSTVRSLQVALNAGGVLKKYSSIIYPNVPTNQHIALAYDMGFTPGGYPVCIDTNLCRRTADEDLPEKYSAGLIYTLYNDLKNYHPLDAGQSDTYTWTNSSGQTQTSTFYGPRSMELLMTAQPTIGPGYKSQVYIEKQKLGTVNGEDGFNILFGINVSGAP